MGAGKLLGKGVCIPIDYERGVVPEPGNIKVYTAIDRQRVRTVDDKDTTLSIDFTLTMK
mgnify:CR=1 FL=1